ncbi:hypothetical protein N7456_009030 [Penicillium angulare]|uniref:Uncharacterized protein n=1 Tax=Penicillium angulare TaxID=116970 RepID=A0A9W9F449_9EURO|nr:hypothetical protein N7456_009030 [Penicillium angulare]
METSSQLAYTNTQFSEASTVAPSELPRERKVGASSSTFQSAESSNQHVKLRIDFKWGNFKSRISDVNNPDQALYIVKYKMTGKNFIYMAPDGKQVIGSGSVHMVNIDADYECRGRKDTLVAQKRFVTAYTHRSGVLKTSDGQAAVMNWTGDINLKTWEFVCVDENQAPVAKFSANLWGIKKLGKIELMGPLAHDEAFRDEMVIVGMTLAYTMVIRMNNIFSLFGSLFGSPGHDKKWKAEDFSGQSSSSDSLSLKGNDPAPVNPLSQEAQSDSKLK